MNVPTMRLAAKLGRAELLLFGTVVVTGGPDADGATLGLSRHLAERVAAQAAETGRAVGRRIVQALLMQGSLSLPWNESP